MTTAKVHSVLLAILLTSRVQAAPTVSVTLDASLKDPPSSGRIVVFLIAENSGLSPKLQPLDGPFWESEQPLFGIDAASLTPDTPVIIDDPVDAFPGKPGALQPGAYRAQACLIAQRQDSNWKRVDGNLFSKPQSLVVDNQGDGSVRLELTQWTHAPERGEVAGVEWFATPSALLTAHRHTPTQLRAGVVFPLEYDPSRRYAAVYRIPGFGGDDQDAARFAKERAESTGAARELAKESFLIVLNPEGPNGHTLFADSANNGPCSRALTEELIPALEARFPLIPKAPSRLLVGHSSGGWSSLWLALTRPDVFGATWSTSPDPVDFREFQTVNIYDDENFYLADGKPGATPVDRPSFRTLDRDTGATREVMTIRREARQEDVLGPNNTSGQQWDSWFAVFGPRDSKGNPATLFDPVSGKIDHVIAEKYRAFDIASLVRADPARYLPLLRKNVHLVVGEVDNFYLNQAVALLESDVASLLAANQTGSEKPAPTGYIKVVPNQDHGSILRSQEVGAFPTQMLERLRESAPPH
jgi:pimeloyl-ACP methyl ester carboxylesterase